MKNIAKIAVAAIIVLLLTVPVRGEDEYKKYTRPSQEKALLELSVSPEEWVFTLYSDAGEDIYSYAIQHVKKSQRGILCGDEIELSDDGVQFPGVFISADDIKRIDVNLGDTGSVAVLTFVAADDEDQTRRFRRKKGDRVKIFGGAEVAEDEFIRGSVVAFFGDIHVYGEVNEDVVAVLGDIYIDETAVVRGDVILVNGEVHVDKKGSVYGLIKSSEGKSSTRRHRARYWKSYDNKVGTTGSIYYNRVDGLMIWGGVDYNHPDSIIPSFEAVAGYAFASERWRYRLGLTQTVLRGPVPVQVGGRLFRELESDDDKILSEAENTVFAFLVNEDWKDYYESQGGYGFARVKFLDFNKFEIGYLTEKQRWLDSHAHLWSLFGAKEFRGNFSSVPYDTLVARQLQFNDQQITSLILDYTLDTRDDEKRPRRGWHGFARYEYSPGDWQGDFDFKRFETRVKRFQPLGRYISVDVTAAYGHVEGDYIPLSRMFYLGGLGTVHGLRHKEIIGTEYFLVGGEYRFRIPDSEIAPFVHYDGGRMTGNRLAGEDDWVSSIGIGIDIDRSFRLFISQRLDTDDQDPVFYARFSAALW